MVVGKPPRDVETENSSTRQRKISICYGSNNNINSGNTGLLCPPSLQATQKSSAAAARRRGEKHSWPNTAQAQQQALQHLQELNNEDIGDYPEKSSPRPKKSQLINGTHAAAGVAGNNIKSKKKKDYLRRQESSPPENIGPHQQLNHTAPAELPSAGEYDEKLMLDEDDLDNFIPNNDLAYNEFMPDGPRGYQCHNVADNQQHINANNPASSSSSCSTSATSKKSQLTPTSKSEGNNKKARRLSSPVFFKSPFTKSFKGKLNSSSSSKTNNAPHESTSWEWYLLRKSSSANSANNASVNNPHNAYLRVSPNASLDSSSLSEINFPTNSTENSFRILEEAILSSGESAITTTGSSSTNGNNKKRLCCKSADGPCPHNCGSGLGSGVSGCSSGISSSSNSNRSSSSSNASSSNQSKSKKNGSFNKIFRKVF
uniref:Uncharacterized protein n=1 Tax=Musca domestica TaxID=7370 RepID=T1PFH9_MUSDO